MEKPSITSPEWHDYVMSLFTEDELFTNDTGSYPKVPGLRRIADILIGETIESGPEKYEVYHFDDKAYVGKTVVLYKIVFNTVNSKAITYKGLASASHLNTESPFSKYSETIAETRAESRVLRKALRLRVCSAEELMEQAEEQSIDGLTVAKISGQQEVFILKKCNDLKISVLKYLNIKDKNELKEISRDVAISKITELNSYQQNLDSIPDSIKE